MPLFFSFQQRRKKPRGEKERPVADAVEDGVLARTPHIIRPRLVDPCLSHAVERNDTRHLEWCKESEERIKVSAGAGSARCVFFIHRSLLRQYSEYFRSALWSDDGYDPNPSSLGWSTTAAGTKPAGEDVEFDFPDVEPQAFNRFICWLYLCRACKKGDATTYSSDHRCSEQAAADPFSWCGFELERDYVMVGDRLRSRRYCEFLLGHFVPHATEAELGLSRVRWILQSTTDASPLQRFARHWVCWLKTLWLEGRFLAVDWAGYPELDVLDSRRCPSDPRELPLSHWEPAPSSVASSPSFERAAPPRSPSHRTVAATSSRPPAGFLSSGVTTYKAEEERQDENEVDGANMSLDQRLWHKYQNPLEASLGLLILIYHILFPFAWVGIAAFIIATDDDPLLFEASKFYSLIMACCAVVGIWPICMRMVKMYSAVAACILIVVAGVLSFASSATCLAGADREVEVSICKMEIGVGVLQMVYAVIVGTSYKW